MSDAPVVAVAGLERRAVEALVGRYRMRRVDVAERARIPGTYWGEPEAGLVGDGLYVRGDTPAHSLLHELGHYVCMSSRRRRELSADAGGDDAEECAVCYLQLLLADRLAGFGRHRCATDMDRWGYSFREGSALAWFAGDGRDARDWLRCHALIDAAGRPTWRLRA